MKDPRLPQETAGISSKVDEEKFRHRAEKRAEGIAALSVLTGMTVCINALEAMQQSDNPFVRSALFSGLVVNYAKAFEPAADPDTKISRSFKVRGIKAPFDKDIHDALLQLRDEQIAHAGHALNDFDLTFIIAKAEVETRQSDGTLAREETRMVVGTRARASLISGIVTTEAQNSVLAHLHELESQAAQQLAGVIIDHDIASLFRLEQLGGGHAVSKTLNIKNFSAKSSETVFFSEEDFAFSLASSPGALKMVFTIVQYQVMNDSGEITLKRLVI